MFRGVPFMDGFMDSSESIIVKGEKEVILSEENMPPHMHHSAIMTGSDVQSMDVA